MKCDARPSQATAPRMIKRTLWSINDTRECVSSSSEIGALNALNCIPKGVRGEPDIFGRSRAVGILE